MLHLMKRGPIVFCLIASEYCLGKRKRYKRIGFVSSFVVSVISPLSVYVHLQHIQMRIKCEEVRSSRLSVLSII